VLPALEGSYLGIVKLRLFENSPVLGVAPVDTQAGNYEEQLLLLQMRSHLGIVTNDHAEI
jgi:hypothetical protein